MILFLIYYYLMRISTGNWFQVLPMVSSNNNTAVNAFPEMSCHCLVYHFVACEQALWWRIRGREEQPTPFPPRPLHSQPISSRPLQPEPVHRLTISLLVIKIYIVNGLLPNYDLLEFATYF